MKISFFFFAPLIFLGSMFFLFRFGWILIWKHIEVEEASRNLEIQTGDQDDRLGKL